MTFADSAYRGIAAHLAKALDALRKQQSAATRSRGGKRGLGARVTTADDDNVVGLSMIHD